jgi:hypothetical protein
MIHYDLTAGDGIAITTDMTPPKKVIITATGVSIFLGVFADPPAPTIEGCQYINSGDNGLYIWYGGTWQLVATLVPLALVFLLLEDDAFLLKEDSDKLAKEQ